MVWGEIQAPPVDSENWTNSPPNLGNVASGHYVHIGVAHGVSTGIKIGDLV